MRLLFTFLLASVSLFSQTAPSITMPTYVAVGAAFNQLGTPRINAFASAIVPVSSQKVVYESTTMDLIPVSKTDSVSGRIVYTFQAQIRQGIHKTLYTGNKVQLMIGGDVGGSFGVAGTVSLAASLTGTAVYQINNHWGVIFPVRLLYTSSIQGWNPIVEAGIVWKP